MFSNSAKYALKAVLFLAVNSNEDKKVMVKDISKPINVPQAYITKLLQQLVKENMLSSTRGPKGGFYLSEENKKISIIDVINIVDGEQRIESCMLSLEKCNEETPCPLHKLSNPSRSLLIKRLNNITINELALDVKTGHAFLPL